MPDVTELKPVSISAKQARHLALDGQGFETPDPVRPVDRRRIMKMIRKTNMLQIDSVNVLSRAHYMPVFSRLGVYDRALLDQLSWGTAKQRKLFEYWGHEASLIPVEDYPLYRWRMEDALRGEGMWGRMAAIARDEPDFVASLLRHLEREGTTAASALNEEPREGGSQWWGWTKAKTAMEYLFWSGQVMARKRRGSFEREYDLPHRIIGDVAHEPVLPRDVAQRALIAKGIVAMGVATIADLRKYFRLPTEDAKARVAEMVENGDLIPALVEGWQQPGFIAPDAKIRRRATPSALMVPFDPVMWERDRVERIFGFNYRIEIYTPAEKRQYGYYVLPFMLDGNFVARVDLKTDRQAKLLRVFSAHAEPGCDTDHVAAQLNAHLHQLAQFLEMDAVDITEMNGFSKRLAGQRAMA
ncbi:winged helix-turn-helix domain-containing protein [Thalassospira sp. MCCC 1A01428]|uniref:winged helix-turn-helix domain-containing protein n=1 Tax=Thalassospira sp. MCCC 1A01428 TaxID=1470575 RepID=UPI000A1E70E8|nr:crosslink repair DNA glycosylase YcaQ family protein [Thalassospira sp. MCCC 1A01428]OSQ45046.1 hypothetical protein THS27_04985 [Thalassospira sp. MCCC 1A01428]